MVYTLTKNELQLIQEGLVSPESLDRFTDYWYGKPGGTSFRFDRNFESQHEWQKKLVFASQPLIVGIMGIGSGKTLGVGMAATTWAMSADSFEFINGTYWDWQSKIMKDLIVSQITDTPAEKLITRNVDTPYPTLEFGFKIGRATYRSKLQFMNMRNQAKKIFSWRGDWVNLDEAALIEDLDIALQNLSTRLTGKTGRGREFLGRMSLMSNPWDNDSANHLYYFYNLATEDPDNCLSVSIPTSGNKNVTDRQLKNTLRFIIDPEERERMLEGRKPEGKGKYFSKPSVKRCSDVTLGEYLTDRFENNEHGYQLITAPTLGAIEYQFPRKPDGQYFLVGDPGAGSYPSRNAPCLMLFDGSRLPSSPAMTTAFWWGNGRGHIQPFIDKLYELKEIYNPIFVGIDSTGPQAGMVQILNLQQAWDMIPGARSRKNAMETGITGLDFSVGRKAQMLVSLRNMIELNLMIWPDIARGIKQQLFQYDPLLDRQGVPKIAQDVVATMAMGAFVLRAWYGISPEIDYGEESTPNLEQVARNLRNPDAAREYRS